MENLKHTLIYDSECSLCTRFKKAIELIDLKKNLEYRSIHDSVVYEEFPQLDKQSCHEVVHLVDSEGIVYQGSEVINFLVNLIPGVSKFSWLIENESSKKAMNAFYNKVNDIRKMNKNGCRSCGDKSKRSE